MSKLFVLGSSGAAKTPIARMLAEALGIAHVGASAWVRRAFPPVIYPASRQEQVEAMTRFSIERLRENPRACLDVAGPEMLVPCVVEGMRNPFDFVHAFDWRTDLVVFVERIDNTLVKTAFEGGLDVIRDYLVWLDAAGIASQRMLTCSFPDTTTLESVVADALAWIAGRVSSAPLPADLRPARVHADIAPLALFVDKPILFAGAPQYVGEVVPCQAFAFSSYPGSGPTFKILLEDGAVFSYVSPSVLRWKRAIDPPVLALEDLTYVACPESDIVVHAFVALAGDVLCFFKKKNVWMRGTYVFTVDWYMGNDLVHCVLLENGQVAVLPHHKMKFHDDAPGFAPYKKLRNEWRS